jgi:hypothetical protein
MRRLIIRYQLFRLDLKIIYPSYGFESNPHTGWRSGGWIHLTLHI